MKQIYEYLLNFCFRSVISFEKTCQTVAGIIFNLIFGGFLLLAPNLRCEVETASRDIAEGNEAATEVTKGQLILKCPFGVFKSSKKSHYTTN